MDAQKELDLQTDITRLLIEAGLDPVAVPDPVEALRGLELLGHRRATDLLRLLRRLGRA